MLIYVIKNNWRLIASISINSQDKYYEKF